MDKNEIKNIPAGDRKELRNRVIRRLYDRGRGHSYDQIVEISRKNPEMFFTTAGVSKTTVFFAIKGRAKKGNKKK